MDQKKGREIISNSRPFVILLKLGCVKLAC
jgi:hypothetical protein